MTVRRIVGPTILLKSGNYFDFENLEANIFTIEDIAHGLSNICRFAGHCDRFYSVAEHSVYASLLVAKEYAMSALLHDAAEAFIGDMAKPLKEIMPQYKELEERVEQIIFRQFNIPYPIPEIVKEVDVILLVTEQYQLMKNRDDWDYTRGKKPAEIFIEGVISPIAKSRFMNRFRELS